jgi:hypothetical protein
VKPPRLIAAAITCLSLFAITGCSADGNVGIKVDNTTFTSTDVDLLANFQCDSFKAAANDPTTASQVPKYSRAQMRAVMASVLVSSVLDAKLAKLARTKADPSQVQQQLDQLKPQIAKYVKDAEDRQQVTKLLTSYLTSEIALQTAVVNQIGTATLQQLGQAQGTQAIQQTEQNARLVIAKQSNINIDPVYGLSPNGLEPQGDSSISLPVSAFAKDTKAQTAPASWLTGLPANQRCV